jgi:hypothetical protein
MLTPVVQRWRQRRDLYRPAGEVINTAHYEVAPIPDDRTAKLFVEQHHYEGSFPAARHRHGLYWGGLLVGVAVFSVPMQGAVLDRLPCPREAAVELGRFVLLDRVPANGETWMLARCFELLRREGIEGVVSFSDPMPRDDASGRVVFLGHIGNIYQSASATYDGTNRRHTVRLLPNGKVLGDRTIAKIRGHEQGWRYASEQLVRFGAAPLTEHEDPRAWLHTWLPQLTRTVRHPGKHRYLFGLDRAVKRALGRREQKAYPKLLAAPPVTLVGSA